MKELLDIINIALIYYGAMAGVGFSIISAVVVVFILTRRRENSEQSWRK